jgi:uncharacterized protein with PIN domain
MHSATFRFYANLNDFLPASAAQQRFSHAFLGNPAIKDTIEAIGPPHPEIDLILVNGRSVSFNYVIQDGDCVSVYPRFSRLNISPLTKVRAPTLNRICFVLDAHLGKLARYLRMLGFDSLYRNDYIDSELARLSALQGRVLLTQDRGLLKRNQVQHGYCVREAQPWRQVVEVLSRFDLTDSIKPFTRCMCCNQVLKPVAADEVRSSVPARVFQTQKRYRICPGCRRVYWQGSHHSHMEALIVRIIVGTDMPNNHEQSIATRKDE